MATTKRSGSSGSASEGPATDSTNTPVVDPSENVKALSEAANQRQDDLRLAGSDLVKCQYDCLKEIIDLRHQHAAEMRAAESRRVDEQAKLRSDYAERLDIAEAKRIDAIRAVDVNAVSVAAERSTAQATVLATQVAQSAEALRTLVAQTAATVATAQTQLGNALSDRITKVEQAQYTGAGRSAVADPQLVELVASVKALAAANSTGTGKSQGIGMVASAIIGVAIFASAVIAVIGFVIK